MFLAQPFYQADFFCFYSPLFFECNLFWRAIFTAVRKCPVIGSRDPSAFQRDKIKIDEPNPPDANAKWASHQCVFKTVSCDLNVGKN